MSDLSNATAGQVRAAWRVVLKVRALERDTRSVVVDAESFLGPPGWVGILGLDQAVLVAVPTPELLQIAEAAIAGLSVGQATDPVLVAARLGHVLQVIGPSMLAYADSGSLRSVGGTRTEMGTRQEARFEELVASVPIDDADESGVMRCTSQMFFAIANNRVMSVCGYSV